MSGEAIAHVRENADESWAESQTLDEHLRGAATLAERFAATFGSESWGRALGMCHDTGKGRDAWQQNIKTNRGNSIPVLTIVGGRGIVI